METRHFINLTNGLEAVATLPEGARWGFLRLQSTTIEHADWARLMGAEVSDDLLMWLALGSPCVVHDRGTRRALSKTIYFALPLVAYVLNRRWHDLRPRTVRLLGGRGGAGPDAAPVFEAIYEGLFVRAEADGGVVKRRVDYYRRYLANRGPVDLTGCSEATERDGDHRFYVGLAHQISGA